MIELLLLIGLYLWWGIGVLYITYTPREKLIGPPDEQTFLQKLFLLFTWPIWITSMSMASFLDWAQEKVARFIWEKSFGRMFK
jgi:hypothetical protein